MGFGDFFFLQTASADVFFFFFFLWGGGVKFFVFYFMEWDGFGDFSLVGVLVGVFGWVFGGFLVFGVFFWGGLIFLMKIVFFFLNY